MQVLNAGRGRFLSALGICAIGAGLFFVTAATARATIVTRDVNVTLTAANLDSYNLDLNLDGTTDFTFTSAYVPDPVLTVGFDQVSFPFGSANAVVIDAFTGDGFPSASLLAPGAIVSSSSTFSSSNDQGNLFSFDTINGSSGNFGGKTGFVGLKFDTADGTRFGFAQITVNDLNAAGNPLDLTIGTVGYNTEAGPVAIPEPASAAILFSAATLLGARSRRTARA